MAPMMIIYFCQGWTGWLYATWMPSLFQKNYGLDLKKSAFIYMAMLLGGMIAELLGGVLTDYLLRRTLSVQIARSGLIAVSWTLTVAALVPAILVHNLIVGLGGFLPALFFMGWAGAPLVDRDDRHRAGLRRQRQCTDECLRRGRRDALALRVRRDPHADRQLDDAVRGLDRSVAVRHCHELLDPAGPSDRGRSAHRQIGGGGRGVDGSPSGAGREAIADRPLQADRRGAPQVSVFARKAERGDRLAGLGNVACHGLALCVEF